MRILAGRYVGWECLPAYVVANAICSVIIGGFKGKLGVFHNSTILEISP